MKKNNLFPDTKKGVSTVITTLIIVLLVLIAIGIVWVVIRDIIESGTETVDYSAKCLEIDLDLVKAEKVGASAINVTIKRALGGFDAGEPFSGVKTILSFLDGTTLINELKENIGPAETKIVKIPGLTAIPTKIEIRPYFLTESGDEHLCGIADSTTEIIGI